MRIGIDASNIRAGGGLTHLAEMLHEADPELHSFSRVVVWGGQSTLARLPKDSWLDLSHDPLLDGNLPRRLWWQRTKLSALAAEKCDVLFIPGGTYTGDFRPFVTFSQNLLPFDSVERERYFPSPMFLRLLLLRYSQANTFRRADGCIFLTEYVRKAILKQIGQVRAPTEIIPYGLDKRFFATPRDQESLDRYSPERPFRLLYVSVIDHYKHQWHVAEATWRLRQEGFPVTLDLIGPAYPSALRRLRQVLSQLDPNESFISYHGAVPFDQLHRWYHQSDAFVFASSCENLPNILLEAMASGLPIACSNRGPMPEVLGDGGIYFDPENVADLVRNLRQLINDPRQRERWAAIAHQRAQSYSWTRCADETFSFLVKIARMSRV